MEEAMISKLLADSGIAALVGNRVFPGSRPQASALPCIVMNRISGAPVYADDGEIGIEQARMQLDCWGQTFTSAKQVSRAVRGALSAFHGIHGGVNFRFIELDLERDTRETGTDAVAYLFRTSLDFIVVFDN